MSNVQKIVPNLWFDGNAQEAVEFYTSIFPQSRTITTAYYPAEGLADFQQTLAGEVLTIEFELADYHFTAINAGPDFEVNPSISFMLNFDPSQDAKAREHLDQLWERLSEGGEIMMPLGEYPYSKRYGWIKDRFNVTWQLILTNPEGEPRPFIIPSLMFGGPAQNKAEAAIDYYTSVFTDSRRGALVPYPAVTGPAQAGSVMFADFMLAGQWFAAMDSGIEQDFTFNEGVSLVVMCKDQVEIDYFWEKLSRITESEQCGWCKDQFGVSWQIVPENIDEIMNRPGAFGTLMQMKKIVIADF